MDMIAGDVTPSFVLNVGLVAGDKPQLDEMRAILSRTAYRVSHSFLVSQALPTSASTSPTVWLVRLETEHDTEQDSNVSRWQSWFEETCASVIYDDRSSQGQSDEVKHQHDRCIEKLNVFARQSKTGLPQHKKATQIWVLAASAGGPEAVSEFLAHLDANLQGIAFIYAQHIHEEAIPSLLTTIKRHSSWPACYDPDAERLEEKTIYIPSVTHQVSFNESLRLMNRTEDKWSGDYSPSIDQLIAGVARCYGESTGVIIFSGMGDDGAKGCRLMRYHKGQVWAQTPETCTVDSMVRQALATDTVSVTGTPKELALTMNRISI